jgi:hypothetical protein
VSESARENSADLIALARKFRSLICGHERLAFALRLCDTGLIRPGTPIDSLKKIFGEDCSRWGRFLDGAEKGFIILADDLPPPPNEFYSQEFVGWDLTIFYDGNKRISGYFFNNLQKEPTPNLSKCWEREWRQADTLLPLSPPHRNAADDKDRDDHELAVKRGEFWQGWAVKFRSLGNWRERRAFAVLLFDTTIGGGTPVSAMKAIFGDAYLDRGPFGDGVNSGVVYLTDPRAASGPPSSGTPEPGWRITVFYDESGKITGYYMTNLWRRPARTE